MIKKKKNCLQEIKKEKNKKRRKKKIKEENHKIHIKFKGQNYQKKGIYQEIEISY